ncbi:energy-coupling factor transporter transmembrane component T family protein [Oceanobacillus halophilus]|uniref:Energy-coupling factor transporter transmembrane protein EcfT n=1 Tax=Oceanobacillus halophilus TaxID=930130 RepID=A0A494ZWA7_9BACI|nr:energy-coupling factor transporter transmembrane component T [Oceanobacillus halophilus]RKQ30783.1 energy-coupling factor transporter transmembrane protein EcfT [Oceanobacillus halophilus]
MISSVNPTIKAISILVPGIFLSFTFDVFTPLIYLLFVLAITFTLTNISISKWIKIFSPFVLVALGFAWMAALYSNQTYSYGEVHFQLWHFEITTGSIQTGISLALRSLCFVALSLLFALTTDSTKLMLSLMQQCKLPPKITYGILAGYRFLPIFKHELHVLRQAHRIRGVSRTRGIKGQINQFRRYSIPLLANGIRKAERVAIAMESKGFTGDKERTHYHDLTVSKKDWYFLTMIVGTFIAVVAISYYLGYLNIFGRKF